jgi:AcrR family transcriptional regulator
VVDVIVGPLLAPTEEPRSIDVSRSADPSSRPRRPRSPRGQGDRLRRELIDAAGEMLENGVSEESLSLRAVARAVGVSAMTPYLHFADRGALLTAVYDERLRDLTVELAAAAGAGRSANAAARLRALADVYVSYGRSHPGPYRLLFGAFDPESECSGARAGRPAAARSFFAGLVGFVGDCLTETLPRDDGSGSRADGADVGGLDWGAGAGAGAGDEAVGAGIGAGDISAGGVRPTEAAARIAAAVWLGLHGLVTLAADKPTLDWPATTTVIDDLLAAHLGLPART